MASLCLIDIYSQLVHEKTYLQRFRRWKNWAFYNYIFMHNRMYVLFWTSIPVETHFHSWFATVFPIFPLLRRNILAGNVAFLMKGNKSHILILWRKSLMWKTQFCRPGHREEILLNATVKQYMNGIPVPAAWSLLVVAINCAPAFNIHFYANLEHFHMPAFQYISIDTSLDHQH